jgi:hypothetical protein
MSLRALSLISLAAAVSPALSLAGSCCRWDTSCGTVQDLRLKERPCCLESPPWEEVGVLTDAVGVSGSGTELGSMGGRVPRSPRLKLEPRDVVDVKALLAAEAVCCPEPCLFHTTSFTAVE